MTITQNSVIVGDFNLDLNKIDDTTYGKKSFFDDITNTIGHHSLEQMVNEDTWNRIINGNHVSSRIDLTGYQASPYNHCQDMQYNHINTTLSIVPKMKPINNN